MNKFNLTTVSLKHRQLLIYFLICLFLVGLWAYEDLGRMENPDITIRQMMVVLKWPGATADQVQQLALDKLERKLQGTPHLKNIKSLASPGEALILVSLEDTCPKDQIGLIWQKVRNLAAEVKPDLPAGVQGLFFNDRFDDVFGSIYAIVGDGYSYEMKRVFAEKLLRRFYEVEDVKRVELIGVQSEQIYVEFDTKKLAGLNLTLDQIAQAVTGFNLIEGAALIENDQDQVFIRGQGFYDDAESVGQTTINIANRVVSLADVAQIQRRYVEPAQPKMYLNGQEAVGVAVSMKNGGNILALGRELDKIVAKSNLELPMNLKIELVVDQPKVVQGSINDFICSLAEAVGIIMLVSLLSLGARAGLVVSLCIPLVFSGVFVVMLLMNIDLHVVSLGTLIIALGLLVDDEVIAVEMMSVKLEEGLERINAASSAYKITAMPMLSGTLITCAGFIPIGFAQGQAADFTSAIFPVLASALAISWFTSVTAAPLLGYYLIKKHKRLTNKRRRVLLEWFERMLRLALKHRNAVIIVTIVCFFLSIGALRILPKDFFPPSSRGELVVDLNLPDGGSMKSAEHLAHNFSEVLQNQNGIINYSHYVGQGAPRFVTSLDPVQAKPNVIQFLILTESVAARETLSKTLTQILQVEFAQVTFNIKPVKMGPPAPYPVMIRVSGDDTEEVRRVSSLIAARLSQDRQYANINFDWHEQNRVINLEADSYRLVSLGLTNRKLSADLKTLISGYTVGEYYEDDRLIKVVLKAGDVSLDNFTELPIRLPSGQTVPLSHLGHINYESEDVSIWRRDLKPTITVRADILFGTANDATQKAYDQISDIRQNLQSGYSVEIGGNLEESKTSIKQLLKPLPVMLMIIVSILMIQLKKFSLILLSLSTAPLGFIGVGLSMIVAKQPLGFVAQVGIIALSGMLIRNAVILIDQIEANIRTGLDGFEAIVKASVNKARPIILTAMTSILALLPLMASDFWGPLAVSISGGLLFGTALTLIVLPCLYAAYFKIYFPMQERKKLC